MLQSSFGLTSFANLQFFPNFKQSREDISVMKKLCSRMDSLISRPAELIFISQPDLIRTRSPGLPSVGESSRSHKPFAFPRHCIGDAAGSHGGRESNPSPCLLLTGRASLQQRQVHLVSSLCGHILMSNIKRCTGHLQSWSTIPSS